VAPVGIDPSARSGPTPDQATGPRWRRTSWGRYVPSDVDGTRPEQRVVEQAARLPPGGAVTGWAALRVSGATFFDGRESDGVTQQPVPLAVGRHKIRGDASVTISREPLPADEVVVRNGIRCTRVARALFDEMRRVPDRREAVVAFDMAAAADLVSVRRMHAYLEHRTTWRRSTQAGWALQLASERSRSPNESRLRLVWLLDAGLPPPLVNQDVFTRAGKLVGVADLLDPAAGVVVEYDGADHRTARRHSRDVERQEAFRRLGLEYVTVTGPDLRRRSLVVERLMTARERAALIPRDRRTWTLQPPPGWPAPESLDDQLDHRDWLAALHAGWESPS
jgi:hypothetical protein